MFNDTFKVSGKRLKLTSNPNDDRSYVYAGHGLELQVETHLRWSDGLRCIQLSLYPAVERSWVMYLILHVTDRDVHRKAEYGLDRHGLTLTHDLTDDFFQYYKDEQWIVPWDGRVVTLSGGESRITPFMSLSVQSRPSLRSRIYADLRVFSDHSGYTNHLESYLTHPGSPLHSEPELLNFKSRLDLAARVTLMQRFYPSVGLSRPR